MKDFLKLPLKNFMQIIIFQIESSFNVLEKFTSGKKSKSQKTLRK